MNDIIKEYAESTGAKGATFIANMKGYGDVWEIRYGGILPDGKIEPTGLPVLVYIKDGKVVMMPGDEALDLLGSLE